MQQSSASSRTIEVEGIPIRVSRKRVRNVNYRVHEDGSVSMSVPARVSYAMAERLAAERIGWIREKRALVLARHAGQDHLWLTGESLPVWGEPHRIEVVPDAGGGERAELGPDVLALHVRPAHADTDGAAVRTRARLVERLLAAEATAAARELLPACEARVGRRATSVTVRRMKTRWGSCTVSRGTIRINTALAEHPRACLEMVLCHELCHLIVPNHGPAFYAELGRACPGWEPLQAHLDANPPRMYPEDQR